MGSTSLIEILVEIDIDQRSHAIRLQPRDTEPQLYVRPFVELGVAGVAQLEEIAHKHFNSLVEEDGNEADPAIAGISPFVPSTFQPVLEQAATRLSSSGVFAPTGASDCTFPKPTENLTITDTWAIYVRPRSINLFVQDIERLKKNIESQSEEDLPSSIKRWVSPPEAGGHTLDGINLGLGIGHGSTEQTLPQAPQATGFADNDILFPKPFNDAQVEIIARLAQDDGVVVQGPPGTGKTHTIANIICHYLATGRNILVVSKGEPALEVLREQIPIEVRGLTISLLTNERQGLKQLEAAVKFMANHVVNKNEAQLNSRRQECEQEILSLQEAIRATDAQMCDWAKRHLTPVTKRLVGEDGRYAAELAEVVHDQRIYHEWLDDRLGASEEYEPRFTTQDVAAAGDARLAVGADLIYLGLDLPSPNDLPSVSVICEAHEHLRQASELNRLAESRNLPTLSIQFADSWSRAEALLEALRRIDSLLSRVHTEPWLAPIYHAWLKHGTGAEGTAALCELVTDIDKVAAEQRTCFSTNVTIPQLGAHRDEIIAAVRRASKGERPFPMLLIGKRDTKEVFARIRVDGSKPQDAMAWQKVLQHFAYQNALANLVGRWNKTAAAFGLPKITPTPGVVHKWLNDTKALFQATQSIVTEYRNRWRSEVAILFPHGIDQEMVPQDKAIARLAIESLESAIAQHKLTKVRSTLEDVESRLAACGGPAPRAVREFLRDSIGSPNVTVQHLSDRWRDHLRELERLRSLRTPLDTIVKVSALVEASGATNWARRLRIEPAVGTTDPWTRPDWERSWRHQRIRSYLNEIDGRAKLKELARKRVEQDRRLARLMADVVELRTYLGLKKRMTDGPLSALLQFAHAIEHIGAGTGVRAHRYRGDARRAMLGCIGSVPCWIMPTWRVSEALPAQAGIFDLVIIDEASQSDAMALPALLRARKVLVVGDDRQVSPAPVGLEERRLLQLRHSYLEEQPFADMLMPGSSLYDLSQVVFPGNRIFLNEHFRCVEPIIRFSFQFYPEKIKPVRIPKPSERLDPPLVDVFVNGGQRNGKKVNEAEAIAIVDEIERIVDDPAYKDRTIGVVSLIGNQQAYRIQELLLERVGEDAFLRFRIACGDAATFQGKERDVMFVSMVASPGQCQAQTSRLFEQRFNVALSRARDRMYLFRSVSADHLRNPNDLKRRVLNHFQDPMPGVVEIPADLIGLCESEFERKVFQRLVSLGYRVTPQVSVGDFRIDLVVDGESDRRLAIELDGDRYHGPEKWLDDWNRQKILERVGWTFWRCWASSFTLAPDECMADLVATMASMGIQPIGKTSGIRRYTEQRTIQVNAVPGLTESENSSDRGVEIGDTLVVTLDKEGARHRMLTLSNDDDDLENGIISAHGEIGKALLGASVEDEIELTWKGEARRATILSIVKKKSDGGITHRTSRQPSREDTFVTTVPAAGSSAPSDGSKQSEQIAQAAASGQMSLFSHDINSSGPQSIKSDGEDVITATRMAIDDPVGVTPSPKPFWTMTRFEFHQYRCSCGHNDPQVNTRAFWEEIRKAIGEGKEVNPQSLIEFERVFRSQRPAAEM